MMVAGVGFRRGTSAAAIIEAVQAALADAGRAGQKPDALATAAFKADEPAFCEAAEKLGVPLVAVTTAKLESVAEKLLTRSERVKDAVGTASVAEAAALAAAGRNARLAGPRVATKSATCALAIGDGP
ncbi:cobalamin biosynthesis domain protein [Rhodovulum sp. PH10]|nr:cobalamin biosynthesis domain protein [Rhodovulum sp. PH10]